MIEQQVIHIMRPIYASESLDNLLKYNRSLHTQNKNLYFNNSVKDSTLINEICYKKTHSDIVEIKISLSEKYKYTKLQKKWN